jgi:hypothetical protein
MAQALLAALSGAEPEAIANDGSDIGAPRVNCKII